MRCGSDPAAACRSNFVFGDGTPDVPTGVEGVGSSAPMFSALSLTAPAWPAHPS